MPLKPAHNSSYVANKSLWFKLLNLGVFTSCQFGYLNLLVGIFQFLHHKC